MVMTTTCILLIIVIIIIIFLLICMFLIIVIIIIIIIVIIVNLLSTCNNHLSVHPNLLITCSFIHTSSHPYPFNRELQVMAYYISFLKTLSMKLNKHTIHFFYNEVWTADLWHALLYVGNFRV